MSIESVAAVVVTYNRKSLLIACLKSLLAQSRSIQKIIVVDNASTDGTRAMLEAEGYLQNPVIDYVALETNTGGAGGFHAGAARAYESGYDWIWLMDDDAQPDSETLASLLAKATEQGISAICPIIVGADNLVQAYHHKNFDALGREVNLFKMGTKFEAIAPELLRETANAFVGPLIHRRVMDKVGLPVKEYFIWGDDTDYTLRIGRAFDLHVFTGAAIRHHDGNYGFKKALERAQYWKVYYAVRNTLWIRRRHFGILPNIFAITWAVLATLDPKIDSELRAQKIRGLIQGLRPLPASARRQYQ